MFEVDRQIDVATTGVEVALFGVNRIKDIINSGPFQSLLKAWQDAENALATIGAMFENAMDLARRSWHSAQELAKAAIAVVEGDYEKAKAITQQTIIDAQAAYDAFEKAQKLEAQKLELQLTKLANSSAKTLMTTAAAAVEVAKNNNVAIIVARAALDGVEHTEIAVFAALDRFVTAAGGVWCEVKDMKLIGKITADAKDQKPFVIGVQGRMAGKDFEFTATWTPGQNVEFMTEVAKMAIEHFAKK